MSPTNPPHEADRAAAPRARRTAAPGGRPAAAVTGDARRRGRALAARLIRMAGGDVEPANLPQRVSDVLLEAIGGERVSLWRMSAPDGAQASPTALERLGESPPPRAITRGVRVARAAAWLALREHRQREERPRPLEWAPRPERAGSTGARPGLVALALGPRRAHEARLAVVALVDGAHQADAAVLLRAARGALDAVVRVIALAGDLEQANQRHSQLQAIFANSSEAILTVDHAYHVVEVNAAGADLMERAPTTIVGRRCSEVLACQDERGQVLCFGPGCPLDQALALQHATPYRDLLWRGDGEVTKRVSASFAPVPVADGAESAATGAVITARDISTEKAASRMQANFISMVSHDLRTPLTTINGYIDIVLEGSVGALNPKQEEFLSYAQASTHQLFELVEEVLFITRVDSGQFSLRLHEVDVPALIAQSVRNFQSAAQKVEVNLRPFVQGDLPVIYADETRLLQVLSNLINNALKFTPPGGTISVEASRERDQMRFSVRDTGEGVPEAEQSNIFERFVQLPSATASITGGYGLGLAIARMIVHQHGGRIWVRNAPEGGAIFTFTIPLALRPSPPADDPNA